LVYLRQRKMSLGLSQLGARERVVPDEIRDELEGSLWLLRALRT
jgi:hypothetical protein